MGSASTPPLWQPGANAQRTGAPVVAQQLTQRSQVATLFHRSFISGLVDQDYTFSRDEKVMHVPGPELSVGEVDLIDRISSTTWPRSNYFNAPYLNITYFDRVYRCPNFLVISGETTSPHPYITRLSTIQ